MLTKKKQVVVLACFMQSMNLFRGTVKLVWYYGMDGYL